MDYSFLVETYSTERLKTLNVWSMFEDADFDIRPHARLERDRTAHEHMVHQCLGEAKWFQTMFGIEVDSAPLPELETRLAFIRRYTDDSGMRLARLAEKDAAWWGQEVAFFDTIHSRAWIMVRRIAHTAHHRGEQTTLLRLLGRAVHSVYGPSVDTGGLPANNAATITAYPDIPSLLEGEAHGGRKAALPGPGERQARNGPTARGNGRTRPHFRQDSRPPPHPWRTACGAVFLPTDRRHFQRGRPETSQQCRRSTWPRSSPSSRNIGSRES